ncbi:MAG: hypothetical protein PHT84_00990 [Candidatus Pacebacteria bacterium]|nr:hypothetical protein [Candidatus Paceibacterota bacterium]
MKNIKNKKYTILQNILRYSFVLVLAFSFMSTMVLAVDDTGGNTGGIDDTGSNTLNINTTIDNPLGDELKDIPSFIEAIINIILIIGVPIVTLAIIYSGFLFVSAAGNPEKLKNAKTTFIYTLIGAALLLGAFVLSKAIVTTVEEIKSNT